MGIESVSDKQIKALLAIPKSVTNPTARDSNKGSHTQRTYRLSGEDGEEFEMYVRQNCRIEDDFSCGLSWRMASGETLTLVRYNGSSHSHPNKLEKTSTGYECHIHRATERYITANLKPEGYADSTDRYRTLNGAIHELVTDCNISGLNTEPDQPDLFSNEL